MNLQHKREIHLQQKKGIPQLRKPYKQLFLVNLLLPLQVENK